MVFYFYYYIQLFTNCFHEKTKCIYWVYKNDSKIEKWTFLKFDTLLKLENSYQNYGWNRYRLADFKWNTLDIIILLDSSLDKSTDVGFPQQEIQSKSIVEILLIEYFDYQFKGCQCNFWHKILNISKPLRFRYHTYNLLRNPNIVYYEGYFLQNERIITYFTLYNRMCYQLFDI